MAQTNFSRTKRFSIWRAHDGMCYWCGSSVVFTETEIDHIIPESLSGKPELTILKQQYQLRHDFDVNAFYNLVPSHSGCNSRKSDTCFRPSPALIAFLDHVEKRAAEVERIYGSLKKEQKKELVLAQLETQVEAGSISKEDILALFSDTAKNKSSMAAKDLTLFLNPNWKVLHTDSETDMALVAVNGRVGHTPASQTFHESWRCPYCSRPGPWNGIVCLSCGEKSEPDV